MAIGRAPGQVTEISPNDPSHTESLTLGAFFLPIPQSQRCSQHPANLIFLRTGVETRTLQRKI